MKVYIIKRKGGAHWYNFCLESVLTFQHGEKIYAGKVFLRKKDALKHLRTFDYPHFYEVVGATVDKPKELKP